MKKLILITLSFLLFSCNAQNPSKMSEEVLLVQKDSIAHNNGFVYVNELSSKTSDKSPSGLLSVIQELSENKLLRSKLPEQRLSHKKTMLKECLEENLQDCDYIAEGYEIRGGKNELLNIAYSYNQLGSADSFFKYGCYDINSEKRLIFTDLFEEPLLVLNEINEKYTDQLSNELSNYEEEDYEYDIIAEYMGTKAPFQLSDLNNFELILKDENFTAIHFHYNGLGGNYKSVIPNGYIEYSLEDLKPRLKKSFINKLK